MTLAKLVKTFNIKFPEDYKLQAIQRVNLQPKDDLMCTLTLN